MARRRTAQPPAAQRRSTADQLRWALAADVCALVRRSPGITRAEAVRELGISTGTAADLVTRMRRAAVLTEGEPVPHGRGRPTSALAAHPRGPLVIAVEITATGWRMVSAGLDGRLTVVARAPHRGRGPADVRAPIRAAVTAAAGARAGRVPSGGGPGPPGAPHRGLPAPGPHPRPLAAQQQAGACMAR